MTKDIELKAIDELIYEVEMFEQAGVYPIHDFIGNLKTLAAKVKEETNLEGCVVVPVEDILNLQRRIEQRYTNANEAINAEGWNPTISGHLDALDWAEQDVSEYLGKYVADVEAARGGNE